MQKLYILHGEDRQIQNTVGDFNITLNYRYNKKTPTNG